MEFVDEIKQKFGNTIHISSESEVSTKIKQMISDGSHKLQVISDFDKTISTSEYNNKSTLSSFAVFEMCESVSDDFRSIQKLILQKYRPIEDDPHLTVVEKLPWIEEWWDQSELSLKGLHFKYEDIEKSIKKANIKLRSGCTEAFEKLCSHNIPVTVLSAGIGDVVELTLRHENLMTDNVSVVSNFLDVSKDSTGVSTVHGYKGNKLIHVFNKNEHVHMDAHKNNTNLSGRSNIILLGDSLGDKNMDGDVPNTTVLRIGFYNKNMVEHEDNYFQQYKLAFDIVLVQDQTMGLLNYLLDKIIIEPLKLTSSYNK